MRSTDLRKELTKTNFIKKEDLEQIVELTQYGSLGSFGLAIELLKIIRERIICGEKIIDGRTEKIFTEDSLKKYIEDNFTEYIIKEVYKDTILKKDVYFNLENTDEGLDMIYTKNTPNKLFKWICNIDEIYALTYLRFNKVVYILNRKTNDVELLYSEHNNCYVYDENDGKIKEVFK